MLRNLVGGRWVTGSESDTLEVVDPATEKPLALLRSSSPRDVSAAVDAARAAAATWSATPVRERVEALLHAADVLERHAPEIAETEQQDMGRPAAVGESWIRGAIAGFRTNVDLALQYPFRKVSEDLSTTVVRRPLGVAAVIAPWNFPANIILGALGPLLAAGNTAVVKPSEKAPLSALRIAELIDLPDGVVNVVLGGGPTGAALSAHPLVGLTHFTGSVRSGAAVASAGARQLHRVVLELGGKDPAIVDDGVDVAAVARDVARGAFTNTGQICTSMERIYVHRAVAGEFVTELTAVAADALLGPMVDSAQREIVVAHVQEAVAQGAVVRTGGIVPDRTGYWYPATVMTDVTDEMLIMREETFGPVAPIQVVDDFAQAVAKAKQTPYGLAATVYTTNPAHSALAARAIPSAITWVNRWQGAGSGVVYEPAGISGMTAMGHFAAYDAATRPASVIGSVETHRF
ncbi:aldehyde dehydrogenase family protein [Amycolatopsis panacis]|uniref:aldehyde dehydrogenase family protein n=1 Tax=Amycolatopsis panacis TaxID=2340917 RepID=UPI001F380061|nr:aldehyde dehydrogenase family protein [Amycolatopsis panacis]